MKEKDHTYGKMESGEEMNGEIWCQSLKNNPFKVPNGYFEELESLTRFRVRLDETSTKGEDRASNQSGYGFSTPENYFDRLESMVLAQVSVDAQISAIVGSNQLSSLEREEGFIIPAGYFEQLETRILNQVRENADSSELQSDKGRVRRLFKPAWFRYAAAACVLFLSAILIVRYQQSESEFDLSNIPDQELINYLKI